jgi:hypothetical protein
MFTSLTAPEARMYPAQTTAAPLPQNPNIFAGTPAENDSYALRGVALTRDAASLVIAALREQAWHQRDRAQRSRSDASVVKCLNDAADTNDALAKAIGEALR